jgi:hypothetical protein
MSSWRAPLPALAVTIAMSNAEESIREQAKNSSMKEKSPAP